jgi:HPt (histidine-containing phosphotransfer) domain-containing protein
MANPTATPVNIPLVCQRLDLEEPIIRHLLTLFGRETKRQIEKIREGIASQDGNAVQQGAHLIKGSAASLGVAQVLAHAEQLEAFGEERRLAAAPAELEALQGALDVLIEYLADGQVSSADASLDGECAP